MPEDEPTGKRGDATEELRTISFRLREIQRLLSMRVEQENRRLEADGIAPVDRTGFRSSAERREE